ncbi:4-hydroxy-3-methylbut-2-en-1-yl diphosphate synthase [candidate division WOR-3 bacterium RBG_13_43_14]|uniref:4-hydroxy-3-methylbut-2-en-1-yl diphosphate synthase (flavodoxin) n=1 Tax=candidate division WOR-3 bacterium RBG_13_43_14 TaxID=1802590 RepID=A0A1F4U2D1_UNCW3|nr:MAG: 4-hydroxy-3-methylbut-2-en-1-yl diphosphate synthase [candidate division WOR-3 bacterium RBG_13_43_14]
MKTNKRIVRIADLKIGGKNPIIVQSMTKVPTTRIEKVLSQIKRMANAGCEMVRLAVLNRDDAAAIKKIKKASPIPVIADIHFDYRLALQAIDNGADKVRINPGNIGEEWKIAEIIKKAKNNGIPIRIGVNSGSLPKKITRNTQHPDASEIVTAVQDALDIFLKNRFKDMVISAKGSDVIETIEAYKKIDEEFDYPLHVGITEAGLPFRGAIRSAVGIGHLLHQGIGNTIRVSLTGDPVLEVVAAFEILQSLKLRKHGPVMISCPTCGRCQVNLEKIAGKVEDRLAKYKQFMKVAVMGCVVNGPGEARYADFGMACGKGIGMIFAKGKELRRVKENVLVDSLFEVIDADINNR